MAESIRALDDAIRDRRYKYQQFLLINRNRPPLDRAMAWLHFIAADPDNYGDQEALVYLASRGRDVSRLIESTIEQWKRDEELAVASSLRGSPIYDPAKNKTTYTNKVDLSEAPDIENASEFKLCDFWHGDRTQMFSLDATMFRTVEWCHIGGFDRWFRRIARITEENVIQGEIEADWAISYLFNMVRSNIALGMMPHALARMLEAVEWKRFGEFPWVSSSPFRGRAAQGPANIAVDDIGYAAALVFATLRIRGSQSRTEMLEKAIELLQRTQHRNGSWPLRVPSALTEAAAIGTSSASIEATAVVTHALATMQPRGWDRQVKKAAEWLISEQDEGGYWREDTCPDPAYLTVLVLDAIALAKGQVDVTFRPSDSAQQQLTEKPANERRFKVAVSFPGEARSTVEKIVRLLQRKLGAKAVFYDDDFRSELARPDLDLHLQRVYHDDSDLVVVFLAPGYDKKEWSGLEWRSVRDLTKTGRGPDVMYLRMANANLPPGMLSIDGYVDISNQSADYAAGLIQERLKSSLRPLQRRG